MGQTLLQAVNTFFRFRQVPVFGHSAVRRFSNNVSEMKQMQGHDCENIIQVGAVHFRFGDLLPILGEWELDRER